MTSSRLASRRSRSTSMPPKKAASTMTARAIPQSTRCEPPSARVMTAIIAREGDDEIARGGIRSRERLAAPMLVVGELEAGRHRAAEQRPFPSGHHLVGSQAVQGGDGVGRQQVVDGRADRARAAIARVQRRSGKTLLRPIGLGEEASLFRMRPKAQPLDDLLRGQHRMRRSIPDEDTGSPYRTPDIDEVAR